MLWNRPVAAVVVVMACAPALASDFSAERDRLVGKAVVQLEELGRWCQQRRLAASRDALAWDLLHFDPDHGQARRWLGFKRRKGEWEPPRRPRDSEDADPEDTAEYRRLRDAELRPLAEMLLALGEVHREEIGSARFGDLVRDLTHLLPDEERFRELAGEVHTGGRWLLRETETSGREPKRLADRARAALAEVPEPKSGDPNTFERSLELDWTAFLYDDRIRVGGTVDADELARIRELVRSTGPYFSAAFGVERKLRRDLTVLSFADASHAAHYLERHPNVDDAYRKFAAGLLGVWVQDAPIVLQYGPRRERRIDGAVRQALFSLLIDEFGIGYQHGWVVEGVGLRLTYAVTGTRLTWLIEQTRYQPEDKALADRLHAPHTDWMAVARATIEERGGPELAHVLQLPTNAMSPGDSLIAYAFADYLLRGRPSDAAKLLRAVGASEKPEVAVQQALGTDLHTLEVRFVRWLDEVR